MLKYLFELAKDIPGFGVFQYISFRAILSIIFSLGISLFAGKWIINLLRKKLIGESIRDVGPESHKAKAGTPTMGGLIIMAAIVIPTLLWADLTSGYTILILIATIWMGLIGFVDDYIKVFKKDKAGLKGRFKIMGQVGLGLIVGLTMMFHPHFKGKKGHVFGDRTVRPSETLIGAGFQWGDQLVSVNGQDFEGAPAETEFASLQTYVVERGNVAGKRDLIKINVPQNDRQEIAMELFRNFERGFETKTNIPFIKTHAINYSLVAFWEDDPQDSIWGKIFYVLLAIFIVTAVSNSVNLTDGIDGLAAGTSAIAAGALAIFSYVSGNMIFADYLNIEYIPMSGELVIFCAAMVGGCVGFLWFNTYPAQVFMGDTGSLMLGSAIAVLALMVKKELLIPVLGGVFFVESCSVILQVAWFKFTKRKYGEGRRIFKMAPIHHHFELKGLHESKIVARFWIIAVFLAVIAFATLKLR